MFRSDEREQIMRGAFAQYGRERTWLVSLLLFWRSLPFLLIGAAVGGLAYGIKRGYDAVTGGGGVDINLPTAEVSAPAIASPSLLLWLSLVVLIAGGLWVIAPGRAPMPWQRVLRAGVTAIALAGLIGVWLGS